MAQGEEMGFVFMMISTEVFHMVISADEVVAFQSSPFPPMEMVELCVKLGKHL